MKRETARCRLPFHVNAMLNLSIYRADFFGVFTSSRPEKLSLGLRECISNSMHYVTCKLRRVSSLCDSLSFCGQGISPVCCSRDFFYCSVFEKLNHRIHLTKQRSFTLDIFLSVKNNCLKLTTGYTGAIIQPGFVGFRAEYCW